MIRNPVVNEVSWDRLRRSEEQVGGDKILQKEKKGLGAPLRVFGFGYTHSAVSIANRLP